MIKWVIHKLASVLPPAIDADSAQMRFSTTQKRLFLRETRFLFFSDGGPVEIALRPGPMLAGLCGGVSFIGLVLLAPSMPSLSSLPPVSSLASLSSLPSPVSLSPLSPASQEDPQTDLNTAPNEALNKVRNKESQIEASSGFALSFDGGLLATLLGRQTPAREADPGLPAVRLPQPPSETVTTLAARRPPNYTTIEEPNDELIIGPPPEQAFRASEPGEIEPAGLQAGIVAPVPRPAPEPMDPEFVSFDGIGIPPLATARVRLHRRFANVLGEVERIEAMLAGLGISPDGAPETWDNTLMPAEEHVPALYLHRDNWREIVHLIPLNAPLRYYYVTSPYGMRTNKKTGVRRFHHGVDLAGTWRAKLRPSASGVVTFAGRDGGFGKVVRVEHAHGIETVYAHLSSVLVSTGSFVTPQDVLGTMGNTGHSDGMHLHYEIRINGQSKDPEDFFAYGHKLTVTGALAGKM